MTASARHPAAQLRPGAAATEGLDDGERACWYHWTPCHTGTVGLSKAGPRARRPAPYARLASKQAAVPWSYYRC